MNKKNQKTPQTQHISLLLLTKNEEGNIRTNYTWLSKCPIINEIVVIDDNSTDNTIAELKKLQTKICQVKIFSRGLDNDFSAQHNFGLSKTTNNWTLWLDADEQPEDRLVEHLNNFNFQQKTSFAFKRTYIFLDRELKHGETGNFFVTRLFNKTQGNFINKVHEIWCSKDPTINVNLIIKHRHQDLYSFLHKINFYTTIRAQELHQKGIKTSLFQIIFYPMGKFIYNYVFKLGFLDSTQGIILALSMSFHSFLVRAKLWHLYNQ